MAALADAITAAENAQATYLAAQNQTTSDQANVTAIQAKLDAANATVSTDQAAQATAGQSLNAALDALIAAATAAKV